MNRTELVAAKAVIVRESRFLIIHERVFDKKAWTLPGGKVGAGESVEEALEREVREETGLSVSILARIGSWSFVRIRDGRRVRCETFLCRSDEDGVDIRKNVSADEENVDFQWVTKDEFLSERYAVWDQSLKKLLREFSIV